jgi:hypothetical protein
MPDATHDLNKQDLLAAIRAERVRLDALFAPLGEAQMLAAARNDGWTAKDILAHITAWERRVPRWVQRWRATGDPQRPEPGVAFAEGDTLNRRDYLTARATPLVAVRRQAASSYDAVLAAVETLSDVDLAVRPDWKDGPSWSWIIGANTHEHYHEHREEMEAWLREHPG